MPLQVQRLRAPGTGLCSFTVVDGSGLPVGPVEKFLAHLVAVGKAPNTVEAYARDLRDLFEWLEQRGWEFRELTLEQLAEFFDWLRRPRRARQSGVFMLPGTVSAVEQNTLVRKRSAVASFYRFHSRRDERVPALLGELDGPRPTGTYQPMLVHTRQRGPSADSYSPIRLRVHHQRPRTVTEKQQTQLLDACTHLRDRFLVLLMFESGLRLGEALGLRHCDLRLRAGEVHVVPREHNVNDARVKELKPRIIPVGDAVFDLYAEYMEVEYGALDCDYVLINLFREPLGAPMTAGNVHRLVDRLRERTGIGYFTPHVARHSYATRLLRAGVPVETVAELLGHASSHTTQTTYVHLTSEDHRKALVSAGVLTEGTTGQ
ncbi:site-specific integrase [Saccharopolyspora sp. K220]|uniref:tyrosine-type recombinase/integrase n=1 Tax=Saccharopolyspora soli TaxID=2926618 RepID=UPI001F561B95|nr:tyrosine-type recombinase/integrase [Saccharopolyspora soli]MCI2421151.1 site-specific integrase [Saccharopolyspora soli]